MRIAYLIAASGNYAHLRRLLIALSDGLVHFYIHIDAKSPMPDSLGDIPGITFVPRTEVWWAGYSQVEATLTLMREAAAENYDYYAYFSGTDYPIKPTEYLYDVLARGGEYMNMGRGFVYPKSETRISRYHFEGFDRRAHSPLTYIILGLEKALGLVARKRKYPFAEAWTGSSWWALSHDCVTFILEYLNNNPSYAEFFRTALSPDEVFFQTLVAMSPFRGKAEPNLTYTDWSEEKSGPAVISDKHLPLFAPDSATGEWPAETARCFFARKFDDDSEELTAKIDYFCGRNR